MGYVALGAEHIRTRGLPYPGLGAISPSARSVISPISQRSGAHVQ